MHSTFQQITYDFVLVFYRNNVSCTISEILPLVRDHISANDLKQSIQLNTATELLAHVQLSNVYL